MLLLSAALLLFHAHLCLAKFPRTYPRPERPAFRTLVAGKPASGAGDPGYIKSSLGTQFVNGSTPAARGRNNQSSSIAPRDGREALSEFQAGVVYMMDIDVGTPRQTITVIVDTGSYELFLNPNCARAADQTYCAAAGHYYPAESSTAKNLSSRYYVSFGTGGYWINMTSFGYTAPGGSAVTMTAAGFSRIMLVDSGSTYSYIDADLVAALAKQFSATIDDSGVYYVSCSYLDVDGYVHFGFNNGAMVINAKYSDFIVDFGSRCALGVQPADAGVNTWVLGATFIRSAYIVFDQLYDAIWLANYQPCGGSLVTDLTENAGNQLWTELYGGC
ncbi:hypothetical protein KJ359_005026 [Pestalotiopsis sp. 9143b]|nr:hypothetical protein KJ359_005026 [Pestalotiopsis sp. 9143b]